MPPVDDGWTNAMLVPLAPRTGSSFIIRIPNDCNWLIVEAISVVLTAIC